MINKVSDHIAAAISKVRDGDVVAIGGFGGAGAPLTLINALVEHGAKDLTLVSNNAGEGESGIAALLKNGQVSRFLCSFPRVKNAHIFEGLYKSGAVELELIPQGNLAERLRASGAGIGAFYTPTGFGTELAKGKEVRTIDGKNYVLEFPIHVDVSLIKATKADRYGNLVYDQTARNFGPVMAMAAKITIVEVNRVVALGDIPAENVITPGIFVDHVVVV
ncbi:3-oxoacid CoA-transferase subunit A [Marinobacter sp.]|uniref:3-oxoacid CoA-transferase subunit A n=1 Tax=Marinobacter sp. TaxID=50741 RepID=UPI003A945C8B